MSKRRTPPAPSLADSVLREIVESEDYKAALRGRMLAGKASASELALARDLCLAVPIQDEDSVKREALRAMDPATRRRMGDLLRMTDTVETSTRLRCIDQGGWVGIGYTTAPASPSPVPVDPGTDLTDQDLLP